MIRPVFAAFAAVLLLAWAGPAGVQAAEVPTSREAVRLSFAPIVKRASPAVVNVYTRRVVSSRAPFINDPFFQLFFGNALRLAIPRERVMNSLGSGVILDPSGYIVTNNHVIAKADDVTVVLSDRREFPAKVLLADSHIDLAVLKIDVGGEKLPTLPIGDSDSLQVGDLVLAIGNPFGVGQTVTSGIVSALARTGLGIGEFGSYVQTDAAINPGNSGGALVDVDGRLVGVNTAIYSESGGSVGIGFAIPTALVHTVLSAATNGRSFVQRPFLGISGLPVDIDQAKKLGMPRPAGVLVDDVISASPADKAGIAKGDVIIAIDGHNVDDAESLRFRLATISVGSQTHLTLWQQGKTRETVATLTSPPETPARELTKIAGNNPLNGATVGNLNPAFAEELNLPQTRHGVAVAEVADNSAAARVGLAPGDVVQSLNRKKIENVGQLKELLNGNQGSWALTIDRGGRTMSFSVR